MAEVTWQARRVSDGVLVDVTGDITGTPQGAPTPNALEGGGGGAIAVTDGGALDVDSATALHVPLGSAEDLGSGVVELGGFGMADTTLTNAQIKGLGSATTVTVVSAPGAGKVIIPWGGFITIDATAGAYTGVNASASISLAYNGGSDASTPVAQAIGASLGVLLGANAEVTFAAFTTRTSVEAGGGATGSTVYDASEGENLPLGVTGWNGGDGDFTGGNAANTGRVKILYTIEDLA